jgi:hypothetical protein
VWISAYQVNYWSYILLSSNTREKWQNSEAVNQLFTDIKKAYDSIRREILYNILIEFDVPMKMVRLTKMRLKKPYSRVRVGKHLSDLLSIKVRFQMVSWNFSLT